MSPLSPLTVSTGLVVLAVDQATKAAVRGWEVGDSLALVPGVLHLTHLRNPNGALGLLGSWSTDLRMLAFGLALGGLVVMARSVVRQTGPSRWVSGALGAILGGAASNTLDRLATGAVTDLLVPAQGIPGLQTALWSVGLTSPPAMNLADLGLGLGFVALALSMALGARTTGPLARPPRSR